MKRKNSFRLFFIVEESIPWPTESRITPKCAVKNILCYQYLQLFDSDITFGRLWAEKPWSSIPVKKTFMGLESPVHTLSIRWVATDFYFSRTLMQIELILLLLHLIAFIFNPPANHPTHLYPNYFLHTTQFLVQLPSLQVYMQNHDYMVQLDNSPEAKLFCHSPVRTLTCSITHSRT